MTGRTPGRRLALAVALLVGAAAVGTGRLVARRAGAPAPRLLASHDAAIPRLAFAGDPARVVAIDEGGRVRSWPLDGGPVREYATMPPHGRIGLLGVRAGPGAVVAIGCGRDVALWDAAAARVTGVLRGGDHDRSPYPDVACVAFLSSSAVLVGRLDGAIDVRSLDGGWTREPVGHRGAVVALAVAPDGGWLSCGSDGRVLRRPGRGAGRAWEQAGAYPTGVALSPEGGLAAVARGNEVSVLRTADGYELRRLSGLGCCLALAFSPAGVLAVSHDGGELAPAGIAWFDAEGGELLASDALKDVPQSLAASPDGAWVAAGDGADVRLHSLDRFRK